MNTQIIAIANQKGGVGKTTTCENLGVGLAQAGKKVLLIDGDPQGSLTISLGHPQPDKLPFTLSDAMGRILMDEPLRPGEGILHHPEGVDLMPADIQLSGMEVSLVNAMSRETILRQYLDTLKGQYSHTKQEKTTDIWFDEKDPLIHIRTHNTALKKRLLAYSRRYPAICQQTDADPETGCMEFDIEKGRFSFRLTAPYSEERRAVCQREQRRRQAEIELKCS